MKADSKIKKDKKDKSVPNEPQDPDRNDDGGETFGNEAPIRDPKTSPGPDRYEVTSGIFTK